MYERYVSVILPCTGDKVKEEDVEFLNIQEDFQGRDLLTYVCPECGEQHDSYRVWG